MSQTAETDTQEVRGRTKRPSRDRTHQKDPAETDSRGRDNDTDSRDRQQRQRTEIDNRDSTSNHTSARAPRETGHTKRPEKQHRWERQKQIRETAETDTQEVRGRTHQKTILDEPPGTGY